MDVPLLMVCLLLVQQPGDGWALVQDTRQVRRLYWDLSKTTEVWVRLIPEDPDGRPPVVSLVFQAFFPGRTERDPYSGLPREPTGPPARLAVRAQPLPLTVVHDLSLRFVIDGRTIELTGPGSRYRNLPCFVATEDCTPNAVEAELEPSILRSLTTARIVRGQALGLPIRLVASDQSALAEFTARINLKEEEKPRK